MKIPFKLNIFEKLLSIIPEYKINIIRKNIINYCKDDIRQLQVDYDKGKYFVGLYLNSMQYSGLRCASFIQLLFIEIISYHLNVMVKCNDHLFL